MIKEISLNDISEYYTEAKKSGLVFCKSSSLYGLFVENKLVAFTGIILTPKKAIFKNHFVPKENRGKGYFKILFEFGVKLSKELSIKTIEATCTKMSINHYMNNGFKIVKEYKCYKKVRRENI
jgi:predicted GNAT family acetyltransferase